MNIDKDALIEDLKRHEQRYANNCNCKRTDFDDGYLTGLSMAVRITALQPDSGLGQVAFTFEEV